MAKPLRTIIKPDKKLEGVKNSETQDGSTGTDPGVDYMSRAPAEQQLVALHKTEKHDDRVGNGSDVYAGSKQKYSLKTPQNKHMGYTKKEAESVYESKEELRCNHSKAGVKCPVHGLKECSSMKTLSEIIKRNVSEGAKVERMVSHIKASEKASGKSNKKAEQIAWATANKRGMLDNKNKKMEEEFAEPMLGEDGKKSKVKKK